jgi:hypothetical protein
MNKKLPDKLSELLMRTMEMFENFESNAFYFDKAYKSIRSSRNMHIHIAGSVVVYAFLKPKTGYTYGCFCYGNLYYDLMEKHGLPYGLAFPALGMVTSGLYFLQLKAFQFSKASIRKIQQLSLTNRNELKLHMCTIIGILQAEGL